MQRGHSPCPQEEGGVGNKRIGLLQVKYETGHFYGKSRWSNGLGKENLSDNEPLLSH